MRRCQPNNAAPAENTPTKTIGEPVAGNTCTPPFVRSTILSYADPEGDTGEGKGVGTAEITVFGVCVGIGDGDGDGDGVFAATFV